MNEDKVKTTLTSYIDKKVSNASFMTFFFFSVVVFTVTIVPGSFAFYECFLFAAVPQFIFTNNAIYKNRLKYNNLTKYYLANYSVVLVYTLVSTFGLYTLIS